MEPRDTFWRYLGGTTAFVARSASCAGSARRDGFRATLRCSNKLDGTSFTKVVGFRLPSFRAPTSNELLQGALLLAIPQIPLSLGNSVIATSRTTRDLFPERAVPVRKIGFTYGLMNLIAPWFVACRFATDAVASLGSTVSARALAVRQSSMARCTCFLALLCAGFAQVVHVFPIPVLA